MFLIVFCLLLAPLAIGDSEQHTPAPSDNAEKPHLIRQITFEGLEHLNRKQLSKLIGINAGQPYLQAEMVAGLNRVLEAYREDGFVFASVKPDVTTIPPDQVHIRLRLHEGRRVRTGEITIEGNHLLSTDDLRRALGLRKGAPSVTLPLRVGLTRS